MRRTLAAAVALALLVAPTASGWTWPLDGPILRPFSFGADPYAGGHHRGIDVSGAVGTTVYAPASGTVSFVGSVPNGGHALTVQTADGYAVTLLQLGSITLVRGATVAEGQPVGVVGTSADATTREAHVHLGIRRAVEADGYLDPLDFLPARPAIPVPIPIPSAPQPAKADPVAAAPAPPAAAAPAVVEESPVSEQSVVGNPSELPQSETPETPVAKHAPAPPHTIEEAVDESTAWADPNVVGSGRPRQAVAATSPGTVTREVPKLGRVLRAPRQRPASPQAPRVGTDLERATSSGRSTAGGARTIPEPIVRSSGVRRAVSVPGVRVVPIAGERREALRRDATLSTSVVTERADPGRLVPLLLVLAGALAVAAR